MPQNIQSHKMWKSLVCMTLLFVFDVVVCKPDYLFNQEVNGWIKLNAVPAIWQEAFLSCHYEGAVLASPITAKLATALNTIMRQSDLDSPIFLGVNAGSRGDFISVEGVPLADLSITWGTYGNGKKPEDCLSLATDGKTYISSCTLSLPYICYKKGDNTTVLNQCGTFDDKYQYRDTGSCYKFHKDTRSWHMASKICAAEGGYLVIINDQREADIVKGFLAITRNMDWDERVHIGLQGWDENQIWLTIHGEKIENVYNIWKDSPKGTGYHCGSICRVGSLTAVSCSQENRFICEKDPNTSRFEDILLY